MLSRLSTLSRHFVHPHMGYSRYAPLLILFNTVFSVVFTLVILRYGDSITEVDWRDVATESASTAVHFFLFCVAAFVRLVRPIRAMLLVGLLFTQLGIHLDMLDEFIQIEGVGWHIWGDLVYLIGLIVVAIATYYLSVVAYEASTMDKLTGVFNRRHFDLVLNHYLIKFKRSPTTPTSLMCLDLDNFKQLNDSFGHAVGDKALRITGEVLRTHARTADVICRSGGEEFEILMPDTTVEMAAKGGERLLQALKDATSSSMPTVTASIGVTAIRSDDSDYTLRHRADEAMYRAKRAGKDRIECD